MIKFIKYLYDNRVNTVLFYLSLTFLILILEFEGIQYRKSSVVYGFVVITIFYIIYNYYIFRLKNRNVSNLRNAIRTNSFINNRDKLSNTEKLYVETVEGLLEKNIEESKTYELQKKEYEDYINSWVHEIKTPITVVKLELDSSTEIDKNFRDSIYEEMEKIEGFVEQSLYYTKIDSFNKDYEIDDVDIDTIVNKILRLNFKLFMKKKVIVDKEALKLNILSDRKWIEYIITQIITNSIKYVNEGGKVKISSRSDDNSYYLDIIDNGIGIPENEVNRVFERGFIGSMNRLNKNSTGMGLYLSKKLIEKLGHDIIIESEIGKYTKVSIVFNKYIDHYDI